MLILILAILHIMINMFEVQFPEWDTQLFIFLNSLHTSWLDPVMKLFSAHWVWAPLYITIAFFMVRKKAWQGVAAVLFMLLVFGLTDQLSVHLFKDVFQRFRPCREEAGLSATIHLLEGCGGRFGFISNHASNVFGLAIFTSLFFKTRWYSIFIFIWASLVAYSRIYVGKHFPLDIICGAAFGMLIGFLIYRLYLFVIKKKG